MAAGGVAQQAHAAAQAEEAAGEWTILRFKPAAAAEHTPLVGQRSQLVHEANVFQHDVPFVFFRYFEPSTGQFEGAVEEALEADQFVSQ